MNTETLNLTKGERIDLTKSNPQLKIVNIGLGWDINAGNGSSFDLDAFVLILAEGKLPSLGHVIYFGNKTGHGLEHMGDNLTGVGDGDDETIKLKLLELDSATTEILIGVNIFEATGRRQNFGMVNNAFVRIYDAETNQELLKYDLSEDYSAFNGMFMGKLYKKDAEWKFQAIGTGVNGTIDEIATPYKH